MCLSVALSILLSVFVSPLPSREDLNWPLLEPKEPFAINNRINNLYHESHAVGHVDRENCASCVKSVHEEDVDADVNEDGRVNRDGSARGESGDERVGPIYCLYHPSLYPFPLQTEHTHVNPGGLYCL